MNNHKWTMQSTLTLAVIVGIAIMLNLIGIRLFGRLDLSQNKVYSLSDVSKDLMKSLDDPITLKCYISKEMPPPLNRVRQEVKDKLDEYRAYAGTNLQYTFIDPTVDSTSERDAQQAQIPPMQVNAAKNDKIELVRVYSGIVVLYGEKKEVLPVIQTTADFEYNLTALIIKLTAKNPMKVGYLSGFGGTDINKDGQAIQQTLQGLYAFQTVNPKWGKIASDINALVVIQPESTFSDSVKYAIDQYVMNGGKIAWFMSRTSPDIQNGQCASNYVNLDDLTSAYGFKVNNDLVGDMKCSKINVAQRMGFFNITRQMEYPYLPLISTFDKENMVVRDLSGVSLFFPSSIDTTLAAPQGLQLSKIMRTSANAQIYQAPYNVMPTGPPDIQSFRLSGVVLGALITGEFRSAFANRPLPPGISPTETKMSSPPTKMAVIGDGHFCLDKYLSSKANLNLFMNIMDWLIQEKGLINIRSREVTERPLKPLDNGVRTVVKFLNILGAPILVIIVGLIRWQLRRSRKRTMELI